MCAACPAIIFQAARLAGSKPSRGSVSVAFVSRGEVREALCVLGYNSQWKTWGSPDLHSKPQGHDGRQAKKKRGASVTWLGCADNVLLSL